MRILQVVHSFPPNEWAGTELVTLHLSQALQERRHEVTVVARTANATVPEGTLYEEVFDHLPVIRIVNNYTRSGTFRLLYDNPWLDRPFLQLLQRLQPEVVHFQHVQHLSVSVIRMTAALGYPTILSLHDFFFVCHRLHLLNARQQPCPGPDQGERCVACLQGTASAEETRRRFTDMERVLHVPDVIVASSVFLASRMREYFPFLANRLWAIPLGVKAIAGVSQGRPRRALGAPLRILYVGALAPHKGAHVLLDALKGLPRDAVEVSLYGREWSQWATYIENLHEAAKELSVKFCGVYTHDQLGNILRQHDVLVMPMIGEETFSILVREAFLAGMPVVAARRGALAEAVQDGVNGLLFEPANAADLQRCLTRFFVEPDLLERLRGAIPQVKTVTEYANEIETVYETACEWQRHRQEERQQEGSCTAVVGPSLVPAQRTGPFILSLSSVHEGGKSRHETVVGEGGATRGHPPKVSVCIPTCNGAAFLAEAIQSVLDQTFRDFELLIVDDRSTDTTVEIARSFADARITIHQNEGRLGIPANWNHCVSLAQGEYICIFHQDDVMCPENLADKVALLATDPAIALVHSRVELHVENGAPPFSPTWIEQADEDFVVAGQRYFRKLLLQGNCICAPTVVTRRHLLHDLGAFDETLHFAPDYEMWMRLCLTGKIAFIHSPLVRYRWHVHNASHAFRFDRGVRETAAAADKALHYYAMRTGSSTEGEILREAVTAVANLRRWVDELDRGKAWLEEQWKSWQLAAEEREAIVQKQQQWITELEHGKAWLEEQWENWRKIAEEREQMIREFHVRIAALEQKEAQRELLQEQRRALRERLWIRLGIRIGVLNPLDLPLSRKGREPTS